MTDPTLRPATAADAEAILVVHVATIVAQGPSAYTDRQVAAWAAKTEGTDGYVAAVEDPTRELVVAEAGRRVVGLRAVLNAVGFYERHGYERVERVTTETTNGVAVDVVRMERRL